MERGLIKTYVMETHGSCPSQVASTTKFHYFHGKFTSVVNITNQFYKKEL